MSYNMKNEIINNIILDSFYGNHIQFVDCKFKLFSNKDIVLTGIATINRNSDTIKICGDIDNIDFVKLDDFNCSLDGFPKLGNNKEFNISNAQIHFPRVKIESAFEIQMGANIECNFVGKIVPLVAYENGEILTFVVHLYD